MSTKEDLTPTNLQTTVKEGLTKEEIKQKIIENKQKLENVFSKIFLKDNSDISSYFAPYLNASQELAVDEILKAPMVKEIGVADKHVRDSIYSSKSFIVINGDTVRSSAVRLEQNTLILRDISSSAPSGDILAIFSNAVSSNGTPCPTAQTVRADMNDTWFVSFSSEENAKLALLAVRDCKFNGQPVRARLKTESSQKAFFSGPVSEGAPAATQPPTPTAAPTAPHPPLQQQQVQVQLQPSQQQMQKQQQQQLQAPHQPQQMLQSTNSVAAGVPAQMMLQQLPAFNPAVMNGTPGSPYAANPALSPGLNPNMYFPQFGVPVTPQQLMQNFQAMQQAGLAMPSGMPAGMAAGMAAGMPVGMPVGAATGLPAGMMYPPMMMQGMQGMQGASGAGLMGMMPQQQPFPLFMPPYMMQPQQLAASPQNQQQQQQQFNGKAYTPGGSNSRSNNSSSGGSSYSNNKMNSNRNNSGNNSPYQQHGNRIQNTGANGQQQQQQYQPRPTGSPRYNNQQQQQQQQQQQGSQVAAPGHFVQHGAQQPHHHQPQPGQHQQYQQQRSPQHNQQQYVSRSMSSDGQTGTRHYAPSSGAPRQANGGQQHHSRQQQHQQQPQVPTASASDPSVTATVTEPVAEAVAVVSEEVVVAVPSTAAATTATAEPEQSLVESESAVQTQAPAQHSRGGGGNSSTSRSNNKDKEQRQNRRSTDGAVVGERVKNTVDKTGAAATASGASEKPSSSAAKDEGAPRGKQNGSDRGKSREGSTRDGAMARESKRTGGSGEGKPRPRRDGGKDQAGAPAAAKKPVAAEFNMEADFPILVEHGEHHSVPDKDLTSAAKPVFGYANAAKKGTVEEFPTIAAPLPVPAPTVAPAKEHAGKKSKGNKQQAAVVDSAATLQATNDAAVTTALENSCSISAKSVQSLPVVGNEVPAAAGVKETVAPTNHTAAPLPASKEAVVAAAVSSSPPAITFGSFAAPIAVSHSDSLQFGGAHHSSVANRAAAAKGASVSHNESKLSASVVVAAVETHETKSAAPSPAASVISVTTAIQQQSLVVEKAVHAAPTPVSGEETTHSDNNGAAPAWGAKKSFVDILCHK